MEILSYRQSILTTLYIKPLNKNISEYQEKLIRTYVVYAVHNKTLN